MHTYLCINLCLHAFNSVCGHTKNLSACEDAHSQWHETSLWECMCRNIHIFIDICPALRLHAYEQMHTGQHVIDQTQSPVSDNHVTHSCITSLWGSLEKNKNFSIAAIFTANTHWTEFFSGFALDIFLNSHLNFCLNSTITAMFKCKGNRHSYN